LKLISYKSNKSIESRMSASEGTSPAAPVKKGMKPWMIALIAIIIVVIIIAAVVLSGVLTPTEEESALDKIKRTGTIVMATEASFQPFEMPNATTHQIEGFDIDLAQRITENVSAELGVQLELEVQDVAFISIPGMLGTKQIDMSLSGMTITDERNETILFSTPYYFMEAGLGIMIKNGSTPITDASQLAGKKIVVNSFTTSEIWVQANLVDTGLIDTPRSLPTIAGCVQDVIAGNSDCFIIDKPTALSYVETTGEQVLVTGVIPSFEPYGVALPKSSTDLKEIIDSVIDTMMENGEMEALRVKWGLV
jgi:ABC-type amino acid transport substrate-binding protein